jgi:tetratricopeptide (TPR) repeat protein
MLAEITLISLARDRLVGDSASSVEDLLEIGRLRGEQERFTEAERYLEKAKERALATGYKHAAVHADIQLGSVFLARGEHDRARAVLQSAIPALRQTDYGRLLPDALLKLGAAQHKAGDDEAASASWNESLEIARADGDKHHVALALMNLGGIAFVEQQYDEAERQWREALALFRRGITWQYVDEHIAHITFFMGVIERHFGRLEVALALMTESRDLYRRVGDSEHLAHAQAYLTRLRQDARS